MMRSASVFNQLMLSACWWAQPVVTAVAPQVASSRNMEIKLIIATIIIISTTVATGGDPTSTGSPLIILWSQYRNYLTSPLDTGTSNKQQAFFVLSFCVFG